MSFERINHIVRALTLRKTDTKKKPAERFSVLIIPRNHSKIRRFECSGLLLRAALGVGLTLAVAIVVGAASFVYYRYAYLATEDVRVQAADFMREKAALLGRLAELEEAVARTGRFAAKIESAVKKNGDEINAGKGPVDEEEWLPSEEWLSAPRSPMNLGVGTWKSPFSKSFTAGLNLSLDKLREETSGLEERVHSIFAFNEDRLFFWASLPSIWPARGWVTSEFGDLRGWGRRGRRHEGIDIAGPVGTPIIAPGEGVITYTGYRGGYGRLVTIDHGFGISTLYGHCSTLFVKEGQRVRRGMIIAAVGSTGSSSGSHLHYEVHADGIPVNPTLYMMQ